MIPVAVDKVTEETTSEASEPQKYVPSILKSVFPFYTLGMLYIVDLSLYLYITLLYKKGPAASV